MNTVGELRQALKKFPDHTQVVVVTTPLEATRWTVTRLEEGDGGIVQIGAYESHAPSEDD